MKNPNGPYPGRQLFLGFTREKSPCFVYLVTGRSPASRERIATSTENGVRIGPLGGTEYDPLRHYSAVRYDKTSGILAVSNGIQTEAIFEIYKLLYYTTNLPHKDYLEKILDGAGSEPDAPLNTPRIAGVITQSIEREPTLFLGIKAFGKPARGRQIDPGPGKIIGISTYRGDFEKPEGSDPDSAPPQMDFNGKTAQELASFIFDISAASYKGQDIRVCSVAGVRSESNQWDIFINNVLLA